MTLVLDTFDVKGFLSENKSRVDEALERYFPPMAGLHRKVLEAARYSVFAGGKRLRPILCLTAAEAVGGSSRSVMPVACALEFIHTYSLIHDDLPAMDDDDFRRGQPTNHKVYGEAIAVLAGDALLTEAFGLIAADELEDEFPHERLLEVIRIAVRASGHEGMIGGQVIDLESESREVDLATIENMHTRKTGALIQAALEIGGLLGGGEREQVLSLRTYGYHLGLAFQITDDLLDVEGQQDVMGKSPGSDVARNKKTYPALLGLERTREAARDQVEKALLSLAAFDDRADPLRAVAEYLLERRT
jgi:geranylgeranyl diphosphate synthase type II